MKQALDTLTSTEINHRLVKLFKEFPMTDLQLFLDHFDLFDEDEVTTINGNLTNEFRHMVQIYIHTNIFWQLSNFTGFNF